MQENNKDVIRTRHARSRQEKYLMDTSMELDILEVLSIMKIIFDFCQEAVANYCSRYAIPRMR